MTARVIKDEGRRTQMGLFGDKTPKELRGLLDAMHGSSMGSIDAIRAGNPPVKTGRLSDDTLDDRISTAAKLAAKMKAKGKGAEAEAMLAEFEATPVPRVFFFRAPEPSRESFAAAAAEAKAGLDAMGPDPEQAEKDRMWREVIAEIRGRAAI